MAMELIQQIDEEDVAAAILRGELQLEVILQDALPNEAVLQRLIGNIEPLGGTAGAGVRAAKFAEAMQRA